MYKKIGLTVVTCAALLAGAAAHAQAFPNKPIEIIVGFACSA